MSGRNDSSHNCNDSWHLQFFKREVRALDFGYLADFSYLRRYYDGGCGNADRHIGFGCVASLFWDGHGTCSGIERYPLPLLSIGQASEGIARRATGAEKRTAGGQVDSRKQIRSVKSLIEQLPRRLSGFKIRNDLSALLGLLMDVSFSSAFIDKNVKKMCPTE